MRKHKSLFATNIEYLGGCLLIFLARALPLRAALNLAETLGSIAAIFLRKRRRLAAHNIRRSFPDIPPHKADAMAVRVFRHFMRCAMESIIAPRILNARNFRNHVVFRNEQYLREGLDSPTGAIWITAHLGTWEILGIISRFLGIHLTSVYRLVKNRKIDRVLREHRTSSGQTLVERDGALKNLLRALRHNKAHIAMLVDQHARREGLWLPFFGRLASNTPAPAILALRTGAPIVLWYSRRLPGTFRFEVFCDKPFTVTPTDDRADDVRRVTRHISDRIEQFIRTTPDQWLWLHRRWHKPPPEILERENHHVQSSGSAA